MDSQSDKLISHSFPAENIRTLNIICKNYRINLTEGTEKEIRISYHNNRFRKLEIQKRNQTIYLEEKMAVTFYGLFRLIELMDNNVLEIQIPADCTDLNIIAETGVTEIGADELSARTIRLSSSSGQIRIRNICIGESLYAQSSAGKVSCILPGFEKDYDIDCRAERRDIAQPCYPSNPAADKKIVLRSRMYVPDLIFTGEKRP